MTAESWVISHLLYVPLTKPTCLDFVVSLVTRKIARVTPSLPPEKLTLVKVAIWSKMSIGDLDTLLADLAALFFFILQNFSKSFSTLLSFIFYYPV